MFARTAFAAALGLMLSGGTGDAAGKSGTVTLSLRVNKIVMLIFPDDPGNAARKLGMAIDRDGCPGGDGLCVNGDTHIDFYLVGNSGAHLRAQPDTHRKINKRRLGRWSRAGGDGAPVPDFYYDMNMQVVGFSDPFTLAAPRSPMEIDLDTLTATSHDWKERVDLRDGAMRGRITIQPVFGKDETLPGDAPMTQKIAATGNYQAIVSLIVNTE